MNKATILLVTLAALVLGSLIGASLADREPAEPAPPAPALVAISPSEEGGSEDAPLFRFYGPEEVSVVYDQFGRAEPSTLGENILPQHTPYQTQRLTIRLEADAEVEYKALMQQGQTIVYSWSTDGGQVYFDFHAHDAAFGEQFFTRYAEGEGTTDAGMIAAPYSGQHGWYWLNLESEPLTITLNVAGFYDELIEIDLDQY